jgi:hypothetical protein
MGNFFGAAILTKVVVGNFQKQLPKKKKNKKKQVFWSGFSCGWLLASVAKPQLFLEIKKNLQKHFNLPNFEV